MVMKKRSKSKKAVMSLIMAPINILSIFVSILTIIAIRGISKGRKLHIKLESLEKGNKR